jgi:hypothetical protein
MFSNRSSSATFFLLSLSVAFTLPSAPPLVSLALLLLRSHCASSALETVAAKKLASCSLVMKSVTAASPKPA